ncbi:MAG: efflux transporter outer membrane subunit [Planctomycetes bacterium]|nr:efflux transporter outer membrane subunit [Planctomycetota bacterium]MCB9887543.1 efflux transporter outer membrane subunit [Planctomycetota bacterium]
MPAAPVSPFVSCLAALVGLVLAACTVGPDYEPPQLGSQVVPEGYGSADPAYVPGATDLTEWWQVFGDAQLTSLIARAVAGNKDLAIAVARVGEAKARLGYAKAGRYPNIGVGGSVGLGNDRYTGFETRTTSSIGAEVSWELDLFGRVARQIEASAAEFQATAEDQRDVRVALLAEVARAYLGVRALQSQLGIAESNIDSQREILGLTESRQRSGLSSELDAARARSVLAASEAQVPPLRINLAREINTLGVLLGQNPQALHDELAAPRPIPVPPTQVAVGVPADLLRQRPDIRAAERRLAAQTARVGVATADLYPTFGINGQLGLAAPAGGDLFDAGNRSLALGPSMRWTLFDGGRTRSAIAVEDARVQQSLLLYEQAVLGALEEVETSMTTFTEQRVRVEALERAAAASVEALRLSTILYRGGLIDYENVLDVQRSVFTQQNEVASARGQAAAALVFLYRALGGGWDPALADAAAEDATGSVGAPR